MLVNYLTAYHYKYRIFAHAPPNIPIKKSRCPRKTYTRKQTKLAHRTPKRSYALPILQKHQNKKKRQKKRWHSNFYLPKMQKSFLRKNRNLLP